jgi:hypothetical protein
MKKAIGLLAVLAIVALIPSNAHAQRYRGNGNVTTPFGQFNMNEMMSSGGDPFAAEAMREQRMMMMQQQQMMKMQQQQMQQMAQQKKAQDEYLKKHPEAAKSNIPPVRPSAKTKTKKKAGTGTSALAKGAKPADSEETPARVPGAPDTPAPKTKKAK